MLEDIMYTFDKNFMRLNNLVSLYKSLSIGKGRKPANSLDILRATTVLAHATLEDYLRNLLNWKLPLQNKEQINNIPLVGTSEAGRVTKFSLGELVAHKGKTVDELIVSSVGQYLGMVSFNNTSDIASSLRSISVNITTDMEKIFPTLNVMIKRRHNIVHRADKSDVSGSGNHKIKSISIAEIESWKKAIDRLVVEINKNFIT